MGSPEIVALLAGAGLATVAFALIERRAAAPIVDLALLRVPAFGGASIAWLAFNLGTFGVFLTRRCSSSSSAASAVC